MASFQTFRLVPMRDEKRGEKDEWAGLSDAKERRKRQNRINQRAKRQRQRLDEARKHEASLRPAEHVDSVTSSNPPTQLRSHAMAGSVVAEHHAYFPLTRDSQLLHVISFNVSRAILTNYFIICSIPLLTSRFCDVRRVFSLPSPQETASLPDPGTAVFATLPPCLMPTQIQQQVPHAGWVDLFPSPQMRDNLILALEKYDIDEEAFMVDLVGEALDSLCFGGEDEDETNPANTTGDENRLTNTSNVAESWIGESGLVSWSDPWDVTGWEVTELFAKKWGFLLQGCRDVVVAANTWREFRGEDPLAVEI
ncbi:hypothetical protein B0T10DRAFT_550783 [Thelonectria olida]|uniref:BZIP domain-containing protein n=1 Tax=Thelonectria olida TaxID=1576542 RepID=A0A9P8VYA5_9HYPO|nr:hypothetical protein B0T10DRAFT_550783 [Thelonectria olida]